MTCSHSHGSTPAGDEKHIDPVCGMTVTDASEHKTEFDGQSYYFCRAACHDKFVTDPQHYLGSL